MTAALALVGSLLVFVLVVGFARAGLDGDDADPNDAAGRCRRCGWRGPWRTDSRMAELDALEHAKTKHPKSPGSDAT